jgi:hypothetical protein
MYPLSNPTVYPLYNPTIYPLSNSTMYPLSNSTMYLDSAGYVELRGGGGSSSGAEGPRGQSSGQRSTSPTAAAAAAAAKGAKEVGATGGGGGGGGGGAEEEEEEDEAEQPPPTLSTGPTAAECETLRFKLEEEQREIDGIMSSLLSRPKAMSPSHKLFVSRTPQSPSSSLLHPSHATDNGGGGGGGGTASRMLHSFSNANEDSNEGLRGQGGGDGSGGSSSGSSIGSAGKPPCGSKMQIRERASRPLSGQQPALVGGGGGGGGGGATTPFRYSGLGGSRSVRQGHQGGAPVSPSPPGCDQRHSRGPRQGEGAAQQQQPTQQRKGVPQQDPKQRSPLVGQVRRQLSPGPGSLLAFGFSEDEEPLTTRHPHTALSRGHR